MTHPLARSPFRARRARGVTTLEYVVIAAVLVLGLVAGVSVFKGRVGDSMGDVGAATAEVAEGRIGPVADRYGEAAGARAGGAPQAVARGLEAEPEARVLGGDRPGPALPPLAAPRPGGSGGGPPAGVKDVTHESWGWAITEAFFGSIWDNTGGSIGRAHGRYAQRVEQSMTDAFASGSGTLGAMGRGIAGGVSQSYTEDVAKPIGQRAEAVFEQQLAGNGGDINAALRDTLIVETLRPTGAPALMETTVLGRRFDGSEYKDGFEQTGEFFGGVSSLAGTAAAGVSLVPGVGNAAVGGGRTVTAAGATPTAAEAAANAAKIESLGVPAKYAGGHGAAFGPNATITELPSGTVLYRVGNGKSSWLTREPYRAPVNDLALPASSESTAHILDRYVTTRPVKVLEGQVAPQPSWATPGNPKLGGGQQVYVPRQELDALRKSADVPLLGGIGAGIAGGQGASTPAGR